MSFANSERLNRSHFTISLKDCAALGFEDPFPTDTKSYEPTSPIPMPFGFHLSKSWHIRIYCYHSNLLCSRNRGSRRVRVVLVIPSPYFKVLIFSKSIKRINTRSENNKLNSLNLLKPISSSANPSALHPQMEKDEIRISQIHFSHKTGSL